jgi:SagB-type dehydrogenase family enzyme
LSNEELSFLLWATQGVSEIVKNEKGETTHHLRTVPSGGARHPFETYLVLNRVQGVQPGIYRFLPAAHKLLLVRRAEGLSQSMAAACYGQKHVREAAVVFVWAAVPYRTEWRYGYIAHRMIAMEAGHVCQNLYLAAESIGAGTCAVLGYDQVRLDTLIGVDGKHEFAVYVAPVGKRAP